MERSRDGDTAQYDQEYSDKDFLAAIGECEVATTGRVAEVVGCEHTTAYRRLKNLRDRDGVVEVAEKIGNANVWTRVD